MRQSAGSDSREAVTDRGVKLELVFDGWRAWQGRADVLENEQGYERGRCWGEGRHPFINSAPLADKARGAVIPMIPRRGCVSLGNVVLGLT